MQPAPRPYVPQPASAIRKLILAEKNKNKTSQKSKEEAVPVKYNTKWDGNKNENYEDLIEEKEGSMNRESDHEEGDIAPHMINQGSLTGANTIESRLSKDESNDNIKTDGVVKSRSGQSRLNANFNRQKATFSLRRSLVSHSGPISRSTRPTDPLLKKAYASPVSTIGSTYMRSTPNLNGRSTPTQSGRSTPTQSHTIPVQDSLSSQLLNNPYTRNYSKNNNNSPPQPVAIGHYSRRTLLCVAPVQASHDGASLQLNFDTALSPRNNYSAHAPFVNAHGAVVSSTEDRAAAATTTTVSADPAPVPSAKPLSLEEDSLIVTSKEYQAENYNYRAEDYTSLTRKKTDKKNTLVRYLNQNNPSKIIKACSINSSKKVALNAEQKTSAEPDSAAHQMLISKASRSEVIPVSEEGNGATLVDRRYAGRQYLRSVDAIAGNSRGQGSMSAVPAASKAMPAIELSTQESSNSKPVANKSALISDWLKGQSLQPTAQLILKNPISNKVMLQQNSWFQ